VLYTLQTRLFDGAAMHVLMLTNIVEVNLNSV